MPGVIKKDQHIQIDLRTEGYGRERLELKPTPANLRYAEKLRNEKLGKIERGTFALAEHFPDSPRAKDDAQSRTFGALFDEWLAVRADAMLTSSANRTLTRYWSRLCVTSSG